MDVASGISPTCLSAIQSGLGSGPFQQCANLTGLESIITTNGSIVPPLNSYLMDFCPSQGCSEATLMNATSVITNACQTNGTSGGAMGGLDIASLLPAILNNFGDIKAAVCIERTSNMSYCIPELLTNIEDATGIQLNVSTIESLASGGVTGLVSQFASIPSSLYCNDCGSALVTEVLNVAQDFNLSSDATEQIRGVAQQACSDYPNFGGTSLPSTITTANSTNNGTASAMASTLD